MVATFTECLQCMPGNTVPLNLNKSMMYLLAILQMGKLSFRKFKPQKVTQLVSEEGMLGLKPRSNKECALNLSCSYLSPALCAAQCSGIYGWQPFLCPSCSFCPRNVHLLTYHSPVKSSANPASPLTLTSTRRPALSELRPPLFPTQLDSVLCQAHSKYSNAGELS